MNKRLISGIIAAFLTMMSIQVIFLNDWNSFQVIVPGAITGWIYAIMGRLPNWVYSIYDGKLKPDNDPENISPKVYLSVIIGMVVLIGIWVYFAIR